MFADFISQSLMNSERRSGLRSDSTFNTVLNQISLCLTHREVRESLDPIVGGSRNHAGADEQAEQALHAWQPRNFFSCRTRISNRACKITLIILLVGLCDPEFDLDL